MRQEYSSSKYTKSVFWRFSEWSDCWSKRFVLHFRRPITNLNQWFAIKWAIRENNQEHVCAMVFSKWLGVDLLEKFSWELSRNRLWRVSAQVNTPNEYRKEFEIKTLNAAGCPQIVTGWPVPIHIFTWRLPLSTLRQSSFNETKSHYESNLLDWRPAQCSCCIQYSSIFVEPAITESKLWKLSIQKTSGGKPAVL